MVGKCHYDHRLWWCCVQYIGGVCNLLCNLQYKLCHQIYVRQTETNFQLDGLITERFGKIITHTKPF